MGKSKKRGGLILKDMKSWKFWPTDSSQKLEDNKAIVPLALSQRELLELEVTYNISNYCKTKGKKY